MPAGQFNLLGPRSSRRNSPGGVNWRLILLIVAGVVTVGILYVLTMFGVALQFIHTPIASDVAPDALPADVQAGQPINILVMGLDNDGVRTDTMMLVSVDPDTKRIGVLQIPRDTRTLLAGKGTIDKINAAYAYGVSDKQFPANLRAMKTVEDLLEIRIHYTVVVDMEGFRQAVDAIHGVWVDIPRAMDYDDPTQKLHIHFQPGRQKLDGKQALEFVRWRHNNDGTGYPDGDLGRMKAQQDFVRSLIGDLLAPSNLPFLPNQAVTIARYVDSTIEPSRLLSLAKLGVSVGKNDITFATLPGTDAYLLDPYQNRSFFYFLPNPSETRRVVDRLIYGIDSKAASAIKVEVAGVSGDGRGGQVATRLQGQGFTVSETVQAGKPPEKTRVVDLRGDEQKSRLVARGLAARGYIVEMVKQVDQTSPLDVRVIIGKAEVGP